MQVFLSVPDHAPYYGQKREEFSTATKQLLNEAKKPLLHSSLPHKTEKIHNAIKSVIDSLFQGAIDGFSYHWDKATNTVKKQLLSLHTALYGLIYGHCKEKGILVQANLEDPKLAGLLTVNCDRLRQILKQDGQYSTNKVILSTEWLGEITEQRGGYGAKSRHQLHALYNLLDKVFGICKWVKQKFGAGKIVGYEGETPIYRQSPTIFDAFHLRRAFSLLWQVEEAIATMFGATSIPTSHWVGTLGNAVKKEMGYLNDNYKPVIEDKNVQQQEFTDVYAVQSQIHDTMRERFERQKPLNTQQKYSQMLFNYPDGAWKVEETGRLDFAFIEWVARKWKADKFGADKTIYDLKAIAAQSFKKDHGFLELQWEAYCGETIELYESIAARLERGTPVSEAQQKQIAARERVINILIQSGQLRSQALDENVIHLRQSPTDSTYAAVQKAVPEDDTTKRSCSPNALQKLKAVTKELLNRPSPAPAPLIPFERPSCRVEEYNMLLNHPDPLRRQQAIDLITVDPFLEVVERNEQGDPILVDLAF